MSDEEYKAPWSKADKSEGEEEEEEEADHYGEDLMGDANDRAYLSGLSNLERETVLAERFAQRKERLDRKKAKARLTRKSRRSGGAAAGEKKVDKLSAKKRELEQRYLEEEEEEGEVAAPSLARRQDTSKSSRKGEQEVEDEDEHRGPIKPEERATYVDALRIRGPRPMLIKYMSEPFFEKTAVGLLVRVGIGLDAQQMMRYRVAKVERVVNKRSYTLTGLDNKPTESTVYLELSQGRSTKAFKLREISSDPFSEAEFAKWVKNQEDSQCEPLSKKDVERKVADLAAAKSYRHTEEEIAAMVKRQNLKHLPVNVLRTRRADALALMVVARDKGDEGDMEELQAMLEKLEELINKKAVEVEKVSSVAGTSYNERVREAMFSTAGNRGEDYYKQDADAEKLAANPNPFVRRKTIQHVMHVGEEADRLKREEEEKRRKIEAKEAEIAAEKKRKEDMIQSSVLLSDMHALKRKKTATEHDETHVLNSLEGAQGQLEKAHDFELELDI